MFEIALSFDDQRADTTTPTIELDRLTQLATDCLRAEGVAAGTEVSLALVDPDTIAALNEQHMGKSGPTDVLSFPIDEFDPTAEPTDTDGPPQMLGDIVVCPVVAASNAPDHAGNLDDEMALLIVHGVLHLLGHDHLETADTCAMHARERALLGSWYRPIDVPEHHDTIGPLPRGVDR